jgi:hypothetical protein
MWQCRTISAAAKRIERFLAFALIFVTPVAASAQYTVNLEFRDEAGQPLPVRAIAFTPSQVRPPLNQLGHLYQFLGTKSHFVCDGFAQVDVPPGSLTIRAGHGFEYQPRDSTINVINSTTVVMTLTRIDDMNSLGWYSGDTHVHITHQPATYTLGASHVLLAAKAEDINYVNSMEDQANFTGVIDPVSLPDRVIHFSKEERNAHFSHLSILGLRQWIPDQSCAEPNIACGLTLDGAIRSMVMPQPGEQAVIATHPISTYNVDDVSPWPGGGLWRGMSIDLPMGGVDAMDLLTYTSAQPLASIEPYAQALNAGFHLPPAAGTDCILATGTSKPMGGYRMYVDPTGPFTMDSWIAGLRAGRSFVTNYPLFTHFDLEGKTPGETLYSSSQTLNGSVWVKCALPVTMIEIIGDGGVLAVIQPPSPKKSIVSTFSVPSDGVTWIVARASGPGSSWHMMDAAGLFAQTAPVYVEGTTLVKEGDDVVTATGEPRATAALYFLGRLAAVENLYNTNGNFPGQSRAVFDAAVAQARSYYYGLVGSSGVPTPSLRTPWELISISPNPAASTARVTYRVPANGGAHSIDVYDAAGHMVRRLYTGSRAAGDYHVEWDGRDADGSRAASGVYFIRIRPEDAAVVARKLVLVR